MLRLLLLLICAPALFARDFTPRRDGFAFSNETVFAYGVDEAGGLHIGPRETAPVYSRRCFVMVRAALQFWKFADYQPRARRLTDEEYRKRVRALIRKPVWSTRPDRVTLPGYADLWHFSAAHRRMFQEELGHWLPTYLRVGNWRMGFPWQRLWQGFPARVAAEHVKRGEPRAFYLTRFPSMNHAVLAFAARERAGGALQFSVYDPNYAGRPARLNYDPTTRRFDFEKRFYFPGGTVCAIPIFRWLLD